MIYQIENNESKRIVFLRAVCVVFVIYLHQYAGALGETGFVASGTIVSNPTLEAIQYIISRIITFVAVPLFFLMSSVLLYAKDFTWKSNMRKKFKSLILPYLLWISIYILFYFAGQSFSTTKPFFANAGRQVSKMSIKDFFGAYTGIGGNGLFVNALWFLRDLIILNLLAPLIKRIIDRFPGLILGLIIILWNMGDMPDVLILNKQSVVFFCLGYYIVKYKKRMKQLSKYPIIGIGIMYVLLVALEYHYYEYGNSLKVAAHSFSVIMGILILIRISEYVCRNDTVPKSIAVLAEFSFFIYVSSDLVQTVIKKISSMLLPSEDWIQTLAYLVMPIVVSVICVLAGTILKRITPSVYSVLTGSRK